VEQYSEPELRLIPYIVRRDDVAIDVGANRGIYTRSFAKRAARCISLEPNPDIAAFLESAAFGNVTVLQLAASDEDGETALAIPIQQGHELDGCGTIEISDRFDGHEVARIPVRRMRLDSMNFDRVDIIKVDVEGHERAVFEGATGLIERFKPSVLAEVEERHRPGAVSSVFDFFHARGYRGFFFLNEQLHDIAQFRLDTHQNVHNVEFGSRIPGKLYINNFLFVHRSDIAVRLKPLIATEG